MAAESGTATMAITSLLLHRTLPNPNIHTHIYTVSDTLSDRHWMCGLTWFKSGL